MALSITEYNPFNVSQALAAAFNALPSPPVASQSVAVGASSAQSAAFGASTGLIRVSAVEACHVQVGGSDPTATTSSAYFAAGQSQNFIVEPGDKLAVIQP